jgi:excisionase family DNA binding protein
MSSQKELVNKILRVHTVARLLGCSRRTIRRRIQQHQIPAFRIGRRAWGIRISELNQVREDGGGSYVGD